MITRWPFVVFVALASAPLSAQTQTSLIDFDTQWGAGFWYLEMGSLVATNGNPGGHLYRLTGDGFRLAGIEDAGFIRDLTSDARVRIGIDSVRNVDGTAGAGMVYVVFINQSLAQNGFAFVAVHAQLTAASLDGLWWTHAVTFDPSESEVPTGWGAYGGTDSSLPEGVTFADVMASYDRIEFRSVPPGYGSVPHQPYELRFDNIFITRMGDSVFEQGFDPAE